MTDRSLAPTGPRNGEEWVPGLAALDIDGTILDHDQRMTERVRKAVRAVAESGIHVVIATGRSLHETVPVLDRLGLLSGWAVCSNGSVTLRLDPSSARPPGTARCGSPVWPRSTSTARSSTTTRR